VAAGEACKIPNVAYGICSGGSCGCGHLGQACCPIANSVTAANPGKCSDPTTVCQFGGNPEMCIHCGDPGEQCCGTNTDCNGTAVCDLANDINPMCAACGVTGNPCCAGNKCNSSSDCCSEDGSVQVGRCVATGSACVHLNSGGAGVCMHGNCQ
jgi:hypothetical protein